MNKQLSINLFLSRAIYGNASYIHDFGAYECVNFVSSGDGKNDSDWDQFDPHTDKAQWADCVLWAAGKGIEPEIMRETVRCWSIVEHESICADFDDNDADRMAATLGAIALALGWQEQS